MSLATKSKSSAKQKWGKTVSNELAAEANRIALSIAEKMLLDDTLADAIIGLPPMYNWDRFGLMQGFPGISLMYNQLDRCYPKQGWRRVGTYFLKLATDVFMDAELEYDDGSVCSGSPGLAYAALLSPRGKSSYASLLSKVDEGLDKTLPAQLEEFNSSEALRETQYDALYGISGIGRYLLACGSKKNPAKHLIPVLHALILRSELKDGVPRICVAHDSLTNVEKTAFKGDIVNCGLAHGVPGPLATLALALKAGYEVDGLRKAVEFWSSWIAEQMFEDEWGPNWPSAVEIGEGGKNSPARSGWCYGVPGVARTLYLAGEALGDSALKVLAI